VFVQPTSAVLAVIGRGNPGDAIYLYTAASGRTLHARSRLDRASTASSPVGFGVWWPGKPGRHQHGLPHRQATLSNLTPPGTFRRPIRPQVPYAYFAGPSFLSYVVDFRSVR